MQEYVTDAVVLEKEPLRDFDARYSFFTKRFGKLTGKATSARKITSKLAGHLEPGMLAQVRFVERNGGGGNGAQIADALKKCTLAASPLDLRFLNKLLHRGEPDDALWNELMSMASEGMAGTSVGTAGAVAFPWPNILRVLGWDPHGAACEQCGKKVAYFYFPRQEFFCAACASKLERDELLLLGNGQV